MRAEAPKICRDDSGTLWKIQDVQSPHQHQMALRLPSWESGGGKFCIFRTAPLSENLTEFSWLYSPSTRPVTEVSKPQMFLMKVPDPARR